MTLNQAFLRLRRLGAVLFLCRQLAAAEPVVASLRFEGPTPPDKALRELPLKVGGRFSPEAAQAAADRVMNAWRREDHPMAKVRWRATPAATGNGLDVVLNSEPGPRGRLRELRFTGNRALDVERLSAALSLKPAANWWDRVSGRDQLRLEELGRDQEALMSAYEEAGYLEAEIGMPNVEFLGEGAGFRLTWPILSEGPLYRIRNVRFQGDNAPVARSLVELLDLPPGAVASPSRLREAGERLRELFQDRGHGFVQVRVEPALDPATGSADLTFTVQSGTVPVLREVRIIGNTITREAVIRREIPLLPGEPFHPGAIRAAQRNLADSGLFSALDVRYIGETNLPEFDLEVEVRERETGRAEMGITYGTVEGSALLFRVMEHNLALRPPWRGDALQARASAIIGSEIRRLETGLRNPRIGDSFWGVGFTLFDEDNQYISDFYDQKSRGFSLTASHPLGLYHTVSLGYVWTMFDVYNFDPRLTPPPSEETDVDLTALVPSWNYERVDRTFRPTRGLRVRQSIGVGLESLGGDTEVLQYDGRASLYFPGPRDQVLMLRVGGESVDAQGSTKTVPLPLRVWLGGSESLRGFAHRSVSPFDANGVPIGGQSAWWAGAEYLIPLFKRLDLSFYYEMGEVAADAWSFSGQTRAANYGLGFLIRADNFPVRFDVAVPTSVPEGDRENDKGEIRFSFSAGYIF